MASGNDYLQLVLDRLPKTTDIRYRKMMGEYIIYYRNKVIGGIYDDRFMLKPTGSAVSAFPDSPLELPYEGAKAMLVIDIDSVEITEELLDSVIDELK